MKALTLVRPWAAAVAHLGKNVENRTWRPPAALVGQRFAIHAGKEVATHILTGLNISQELLGLPTLADAGPTGIVYTVRLAGVFTAVGYLPRAECDAAAAARGFGSMFSHWFMGPVGWVLADVRALATPVPCRGAQGLWTLPADVEAAVLAQEGGGAPRAPRVPQDRPWSEYPLGTLAHAYNGGAWLRVADGWQWNGHLSRPGSTFPTPGGDAVGACVEIPTEMA